FFDWPLDRTECPIDHDGPVAADYPICLKRVVERVKPERDRNPRKSRRENWWQFADKAADLYIAISSMKWVLPVSSISKHPSFCPVRTDVVFDQNLTVLACDDWSFFAVVNSRIHLEWAAEYSSTLESRMGYRPTDCFDTFPFPRTNAKLSD